MEKRIFTAVLLLVSAFAVPLWAQDLSISDGDLLIEQRVDGGFHLFIRKKPETNSVLLTESTRDPYLRSENYAYRASEWNAVNGDEIRILDGRPIPRESRVYSLIDSTPEMHPLLGEAFHIYIPWILNYGYEDSRHGETYVSDGTYLNIRAFALPYADYRGAFRDNPFTLRVTPQEPLAGPPEGNFMKDTVVAFREISNGDITYSTGAEDLVEKIRNALYPERGKNVDIVICLDATGSMRNDIDAVRAKLIPMLTEVIVAFKSFRIGMVLYKDYNDEYLTKIIPFTTDFAAFQRTLNAVRPGGGGDIPEAVYEALYDGAVKFNWEAESKILLLIGDAPPHPRPKGKITKEMVNQAAAERGLTVRAIILPQ